MCASLSRQLPYAYVYVFYGGAQKSLMGQYSIFEMDQTHVGGVLNHFQGTGANEHIICLLYGGMTQPKKLLGTIKRI